MSPVQASTLKVRRRFGGSFLRVSGTSIVDATGNAVMLRGASFSDYEYGITNTHHESDYQKMASWGFNVVRLQFGWSFLEPQPGKYDESYLAQYVDRDIAWAAKYGLYVILDMHQYEWSPYFTIRNNHPWTAGLPLWAVSGYPNTGEGQAHAKADFWNNLGPNGAVVSETNPSMQDRFAMMWKYVASRYVGESVIAGYDLINEPTACSSDDCKFIFYDVSLFRTVALPAFYEKVADAIRTVDSDHILFWESDWGPHNSETTAPRRPNMVYSPHYPGWWKASFLDSYTGDKSALLDAVETILRFGADNSQPVWIGEWGICVEGTNVTQYIRDLGDVMDTHGVGWSWWTYGAYNFGMNLLDENGVERATLVDNLLWVMVL
jgi:endoglycosylceramidase